MEGTLSRAAAALHYNTSRAVDAVIAVRLGSIIKCSLNITTSTRATTSGRTDGRTSPATIIALREGGATSSSTHLVFQ
jgi:hypothetical protein